LVPFFTTKERFQGNLRKGLNQGRKTEWNFSQTGGPSVKVVSITKDPRKEVRNIWNQGGPKKGGILIGTLKVFPGQLLPNSIGPFPKDYHWN